MAFTWESDAAKSLQAYTTSLGVSPTAAYSHDLVNQQSVQGGIRYPGTVSLFNS